jgi:DtxR family transcriptional regulator, Mn-dependent transcriptional regulator
MTRQRLSPSQEDYLKAILLAGKRGAEVRPVDLARNLRVTAPSVTEALQNLKKRGLVNYRPYQKVSLTDTGLLLALEVRQRHQRLHGFLKEILLLDDDKADAGACLMEHVVSEEILNRMIAYSKYIEEQSGIPIGSRAEFRSFLDRQEHCRHAVPEIRRKTI